MPQSFCTPSHWFERGIRILLLGAGGTGGEVLYALARTHTMLRDLGHHPAGFLVTVMDGDCVSSANIGRQRFYRCDVAHNKAKVLVQRHNLAFMLNWRAIDRHWSREDGEALSDQVDLLITCVDRASVRVAIARSAAASQPALLWMDCGNGQYNGQCVLGHLGRTHPNTLHLPNVFDLYPELAHLNDEATPSCSSEEAIQQQDLFVNPLVADAAVSLIWKLLRTGRTDTHGALVDARGPCVTPLAIDPQAWQFYSGAGPVAHAGKMRLKGLRPARRRRARVVHKGPTRAHTG
jgi:PRTRC genetic system ThiF family protein